MSVGAVEVREASFESASGGLWGEAWVRLRRNPGAIAGFVIVAAVVFIAIFAPFIAPYPPREQNLSLIRGGCCPGPSAASLYVRSLTGQVKNGNLKGYLAPLTLQLKRSAGTSTRSGCASESRRLAPGRLRSRAIQLFRDVFEKNVPSRCSRPRLPQLGQIAPRSCSLIVCVIDTSRLQDGQ